MTKHVYKLLLFVAVASGIFLIAGTGHGSKVNALGPKYFQDTGSALVCDIKPCNVADIQSDLGETRAGQGSELNVTAYFTASSGSLTIHQANYCPSQSGNPDYSKNGDYFDKNPTALANNTPVTKILLTYTNATTGSIVTITKYGNYLKSASSACNADLTIDATQLTDIQADATLSLYPVKIVITPIDVFPGPCGNGDDTFCDGIVNDLSLEAAGSTSVIAQNGDKVDKNGHKITLNEVAGGTYADYIVRFGSDCSVDGTTPTQLSYYDMDNDPNNGPQIGSGPRITMTLYDETAKANVATSTKAAGPYTSTGNWQPPDDQNNVGFRYFVPQVDHKYVWTIHNVYYKNTIQVGTPFDGIYYLKSCAGGTTPTPPPPPPPVQPFFKVTGSDVITGASFSTATVPCTGATAAPHVTTAGIVSWNRNGPSTYQGAGGEYAARAYGYIEQFVTHQTAAATGTTELSFANINTTGSVDPTNGLFGGMFGSAPCVDYWGKRPDLTKLTNTNGGDISSLNGTFAHITGNLAIDESQIPDSAHITIYVEGNLAINGNITYRNTTWPNKKSIPSVRLIVHGSIFIDEDVTQLDGLYVAVPSTGGYNTTNSFANPIPGTIITCSNASLYRSYNPANYVSSNIEDECGSQLVVNGSLVAQQIWLLRAYGSLASNQPAEIINYRPELWMAPNRRQNLKLDSSYESIIGLPPQL